MIPGMAILTTHPLRCTTRNMIVYQSFKALPSGFESFVFSLCPRYRPFDRLDTLNSWRLRNHPNLVLMEGAKIRSHDDGGEFFQPMIILRNSSWSIRGSSQKVKQLDPQNSGSIIVLDISKKHCVSGRGSPWLTLCWNPQGSVPLKSKFDERFCVESLLSDVETICRQLPID